MPESTVENDINEVPDIDEELESLLIQVLEEAQDRMSTGEQVLPFTSTIVGNKLFQETHEGSTEECFASARDTVCALAAARAYAFCYDGYIDTDEGQKDAIIAEGGVAGDSRAVVVGLMYDLDEEGSVTGFDEEVVYIAETDNFLKDAQLAATQRDAEDIEEGGFSPDFQPETK